MPPKHACLISGTSQRRDKRGRPSVSSRRSIMPRRMTAPAELSVLDSVPKASIPTVRKSGCRMFDRSQSELRMSCMARESLRKRCDFDGAIRWVACGIAVACSGYGHTGGGAHMGRAIA